MSEETPVEVPPAADASPAQVEAAPEAPPAANAPAPETTTTAAAATAPDTAPETEPVAPPPPPKDAVKTEAEPASAPEAATEAPPGPAPEPKPEPEPKAPSPTPIQELWAVASAHAYPEIWGVTLADPADHVPTQIILQKYLNANDGDLAKARDQLTKTLDWRAQMKPLELLERRFSQTKFEALGYATAYAPPEAARPHVFTWNIYGGAKSIDETFGDLDEFIRWRVALMELALQQLSLSTATEPIKPSTASGDPDKEDPYKIVQVHDYRSISFFRQSAVVKTASTETIRVFAQNYPELLREKFFVNVPAIMGFMYAVIKLFVAPRTAKKFHPMSNGGALAGEFARFSGLGDLLPAEYGGKGPALKESGKEPLLE